MVQCLYVVINIDCCDALKSMALIPSVYNSKKGYGDNKPKSSTTAQEVKTLDGIYIEQVNGDMFRSARF